MRKLWFGHPSMRSNTNWNARGVIPRWYKCAPIQHRGPVQIYPESGRRRQRSSSERRRPDLLWIIPHALHRVRLPCPCLPVCPPRPASEKRRLDEQGERRRRMGYMRRLFRCNRPSRSAPIDTSSLPLHTHQLQVRRREEHPTCAFQPSMATFPL
eukprot:326077-Rhodomonas_salina.1